MEENEITHLIIDIDKVIDRIMTPETWFARWGVKLRAFALAPPEIDDDELEEATEAANKAEAEVGSLRKAMETAVKMLDDIEVEKARDAIDNVVTHLENAL